MGHKQLSLAQEKHLIELVTLKDKLVAEADAQINNFVTYLRNEHDAPVEEWEITEVRKGFTTKEPKPPGQGKSKAGSGAI